MAKIRVMSYLDTNAPQYPASQRDAMLSLVKMLNETSYNTTYPVSLVVDSNTKTINLSFSTPHGFTEGHLLEILNTNSSVFQSDSYRVIQVPTTTTLVCKIDNYDSFTYPLSDDSSTMSVFHKKLNWEVVFSSSTQYSIRSRDLNSSRNILTLKEPTLARLKFNVATYSAPACVSVSVSPIVNSSTGEIINSYTSGNNLNNVESFYWSSYHNGWDSTSVTPSAANTSNNDHLLPWFLIGDDKFFYLIVSGYSTSTSYNLQARNPSRSLGTNTNWYTYRQCYSFGDPDFLGDSSFIDVGGTVFSSLYKPGGTNAGGSSEHYPAVFTEDFRSNVVSTNYVHSIGSYFIRPLDMSGNVVYPLSLSTMDYPYTSPVCNFTTSGSYMQYPHTSTRGLIFFPYYTRVYIAGANTLNYYRSILPFARFCPINISNLVQNWVGLDYTLIKATNGSQILSIVRYGSNATIQGSYLYELD